MLRVVPVLALVTAFAAIAPPAQAQSVAAADRLVQELLAAQDLQPSDRIWIALPLGEPSARDVAVADALSEALTARGLTVMGNLGIAPSPTDSYGFQTQLAALKAMGVTKILGVGQTDDLGNLKLRIIEAPGGWLKRVKTVNLGDVASESKTMLAGPGGVIPVERLVSWNPRHGVGLQYSSLSGSGATYRHWTESGWGIQLAGIPALTFTNNRMEGFVNVGLQGMRSFLKTDRLRLYTLLGIGALYRPNVTYSRFDPDSQTYSPKTGDAWDLGLAPGLGMDYRVHDRILLTGALGYTFSRQSVSTDAPTYAYSPGFTLGTLIEW
jgi:opacity protein-like surface antigen